MLEMLGLISKSALLLGLFVCSWIDLKKQVIYLLLPGIFGVFGLLLHIFSQNISIYSIIGGIALGASILVLAWLSGEAIGFGDGVVFMLTGIYLGFWNNMFLFALSTGFAGLLALVLLITKKKARKDRMPMTPFVFLAYFVMLL